MSVASLRESGILNVNYPEDLRGAVSTAVESWRKFCQLPKEEKCLFNFVLDEIDGAGYELKEEKGAKKDLKENFHVTLYQHPRLTKIAGEASLQFLNNAQQLLDKIEPLVLQVAAQMEHEFNLAGVVQGAQEGKSRWTLRYLHYFGDQEKGKEIALPHTDKGVMTLHLYESDTGLEYYDLKERTWKTMPIAEQGTVIITAAQLQFLSQGSLQALYHRVVATEKTAQVGRYSMVCFIPFQNTPLYNKSSYGAMQTHLVGYNYGMPHPEYAKFFVTKDEAVRKVEPQA